jgi:hypothetical protein
MNLKGFLPSKPAFLNIRKIKVGYKILVLMNKLIFYSRHLKPSLLSDFNVQRPGLIIHTLFLQLTNRNPIRF